jgi:hypothetical protein
MLLAMFLPLNTYRQYLFIKQCDCIVTTTKTAKTAPTLFNTTTKNTKAREQTYLHN